MRIWPASSFALSSLLILAVACGGDDDDEGEGGGAADAAASIDASGGVADAAGQPDAMPADLSCLGNPLPTEAVNPVTVSGSVFTVDAGGQSPVEGAVVQIRRSNNDRVLDSNGPTGTPADGTFSLTANTRGAPLDAYLRATADGFVTTRLYPPFPFSADTAGVPLPIFNPVILEFLAPDQDPANGLLFVIVVDCSGNPIQGATVSSTPEAGQILYASNTGVPDESATSTGSTGLVYLINVPAGPVTVSASAMGEALLDNDVMSVAGEVTTTVVLPGPPAL
jgi:hypothetical protein